MHLPDPSLAVESNRSFLVGGISSAMGDFLSCSTVKKNIPDKRRLDYIIGTIDRL